MNKQKRNFDSSKVYYNKTSDVVFNKDDSSDGLSRIRSISDSTSNKLSNEYAA